MDALNNISITCFAASYLVAFALEISRIFFKAPFRRVIRIGFVVAGLVAHSLYLLLQAQVVLGNRGIAATSWFGWCLSVAWILALAYLWIAIRKPHSIFGLLVLPVVLSLIGIGIQFRDQTPFDLDSNRSIGSMIHGIALALGTAVVVLGFLCAVAYLFQAYRLKKKIPPSKRFRLPSLEWLQRSSETALLVSSVLLGIGLIAGIAITQNAPDHLDESGIPWSDPVVWTSGLMFLWLVAASAFSLLYRPARVGRKVAYLVLATFLFLVLEMVIVWQSGHATSPEERGTPILPPAETNRLDNASTPSPSPLLTRTPEKKSPPPPLLDSQPELAQLSGGKRS